MKTIQLMSYVLDGTFVGRVVGFLEGVGDGDAVGKLENEQFNVNVDRFPVKMFSHRRGISNSSCLSSSS